MPSSALPELVQAGVLTAAGVAVWSMWEGYLAQPSGKRIVAAMGGIPFTTIHTSGHASVPALQQLVEALDPATIVPIHSEAGDRFAELFPRVDRRGDGEWWEVR